MLWAPSGKTVNRPCEACGPDHIPNPYGVYVCKTTGVACKDSKMKAHNAVYLFNGAVSDLLDIAEAVPVIDLVGEILAMERKIADAERAVQTMRDAYNCLKAAGVAPGISPVIRL